MSDIKSNSKNTEMFSHAILDNVKPQIYIGGKPAFFSSVHNDGGTVMLQYLFHIMQDGVLNYKFRIKDLEGMLGGRYDVSNIRMDLKRFAGCYFKDFVEGKSITIIKLFECVAYSNGYVNVKLTDEGYPLFLSARN